MNFFQAIYNLTNGAEFTINDHDLSTLVFNDSKVKAPTQTEIDAEIARMSAAEIAKENAKAALLERLGISAEEAKLLLS